MASNRQYAIESPLGGLTPSNGGVNSGDPARVGKLTGVSLNGVASDGTIVLDRRGVYNLPVAAADAGGNSAVAVGDELFYLDAGVTIGGQTTKITKNATGVHFGYAMDAVTSGALATIRVVQGW